MTDELPFPPGSPPPLDPNAPLRASIAKFRSLVDTRVQEQIETTWPQWIEHLAADPANEYAGQMEHGGWSPVVFEPAKRAKENARAAFALVLDYDKGAAFDRVTALWREHFGLVYTTKSHGVNGDRARVLLPLARCVTADEYSKLWDWAARRSRDVNLTADAQAKDVSRFWYDPSTPPGGWRAERLSGEPLNPDPIIALAPEPPRLRAVPLPIAPSADIRIERARRYVAKIPGAVSGASGHTTTFNAVAHVMFGFDLDPDTTLSVIASDYNPRCDPPWSERELLHKIRSVAERCTRERGYLLNERPRVHTTQDAADRAPPVPDELEANWRSLAIYKSDRTTPKRAYHNVAVFVRHHLEYRGHWSIDEMTKRPWFDGREMPDTMVHDIRAHADREMGFTPSVQDVEAAIVAAAHDRPFHPIRQYLRSIDWDGTERLASMANDYLSSDLPLHAEMVRRWMIGAAARALWPGCKLDTALMLVGPQGFYKSTFFAVLGGEWHSDSFVDITNKDSFVQIHAAWIYELAELENVVTGRAESRLKAWLTSTHDTYRAPYQRSAERRPRACVLCGTTNRQQFLTDDTGSRRFWIVPVGKPIDAVELGRARDQLWAEAVCAAEAGESWWLDGERESEREEANRDFHESDPWQNQIADYLEPPTISGVTTEQILSDALKLDPGRRDRSAQMRVARVLVELGWTRQRVMRGGVRQWRFTR